MHTHMHACSNTGTMAHPRMHPKRAYCATSALYGTQNDSCWWGGCWQLTFSYQTCYALPLIVTHSCVFLIFPVNFNENLICRGDPHLDNHNPMAIMRIFILQFFNFWGKFHHWSSAYFITGLQHISDSGCLLCIYVVTVTRIFILEHNVSKRKHQKQYPRLSIML